MRGWTVASVPRMRNNIDRVIGRPSGNGLDPFQQEELVYPRGASVAVIVDLDTDRLKPEHLQQALRRIGEFGYGRDASVGLGKFEIASTTELAFEGEPCDGALTLAPCAPASNGIDPARSFYRPLTRFGRHGSADALRGRPFKAPVLLAAAGALLAFPAGVPRIAGRGLGGDGSLSTQRPATVHQGYAPVWPVHLGY
jgi:CRISPR-associated protein Csm4